MTVEVGHVFGHLTVKEVDHENNTALCYCSCGREVRVDIKKLLNKTKTSCGNEFCKHNPNGYSKHYASKIRSIHYRRLGLV